MDAHGDRNFESNDERAFYRVSIAREKVISLILINF